MDEETKTPKWLSEVNDAANVKAEEISGALSGARRVRIGIVVVLALSAIYALFSVVFR